MTGPVIPEGGFQEVYTVNIEDPVLLEGSDTYLVYRSSNSLNIGDDVTFDDTITSVSDSTFTIPKTDWQAAQYLQLIRVSNWTVAEGNIVEAISNIIM